MPNEFARTSEGILLVASGFDPVLRWDGYQSQAILAGVKAPEDACTMASSGAGSIAGDYYAYVRFVDRWGNYSDLSPISGLLRATGTTTLYLTGASATAPIKIECVNHGLTTGARVTIENLPTLTAANGTWTITVINADIFSLDGSDGRGYQGYPRYRIEIPGPLVAVNGVVVSGVRFIILDPRPWPYKSSAKTITYSSIPRPKEERVARRQILRNTNGQTQTFYVDIDTDDLTSTSLSSTRTDSELLTQEAQALLEQDNTPLANRYGVPPDTKSYLANHLNRMFAAGEVEYSEGNVKVTFGSTTVQGIGTEWTHIIPGRFLHVPGGTKAFEIDSVNVAAQTLELTEAWDSDSQAYADYAIRPEDPARRIVAFSEAGLAEAWPAINGFSLPEDGDVITGLMPKSGFLYVLERRNIYRYTAQTDPLKDGFVFHAANRGCINNRCWVVVDETAYLLDEMGIYSFEAGEEWKDISEPIQDIIDGSNPTWAINWRASRYFHAVYEPGPAILRWFVALAGEYLPRHALCYAHREQRWWMEEYPFRIGASVLGRLNGRPQIYLGGEAGHIIALGRSRLDGVRGREGTVRGTATATGLVTLTDSTASFPSNLAGLPVAIVDGRGKGQIRRIIASTATVLTVSQPWLIKPDTTSVYQIGAAPYVWRSGVYRLFNDGEMNTPRRIEVIYEPHRKDSSFDLRVRRDRSKQYLPWAVDRTSDEGNGVAATAESTDLVCDLTREIGLVQQRLDHHREWYTDGVRYYQWELRGMSNEERTRFYQMLLDGHEPPPTGQGG